MNISIIAGTFFPHAGGVQVEIHNVANRLIEKGHSVDVYVFKKIKLKNNLYRIVKINYFLLSFLYILKIFFNYKLIKIFNKFNLKFIKTDYDIYHFHFITFKSLILIEYLKFLKKKVLVTFHGADIQIKKNINYGFRINKKFNTYLKEIVKKIDGYQCISNNIYKDLLKINIKNQKIFFIPNSIYLKKIKYKKSNDKYLNLITVGRYAKYKKGFDLLPKIANKLIQKKIKFKWKIIGKNSNKIYEDDFIAKNKKDIIAFDNIQNNNETYFPPKELLKHYSNANLYVNLARIESFGLTFIESLACNTPIISFKSKGINEILKNKINGYFVNNVNELIKTIHKIYLNRSLNRKISFNCKKTVEKFDLNKNYTKLISFYKKFTN